MTGGTPAPDGLALHADARRVLTAYSPIDDAQAQLRADYLEFLDAHDDAMTRACTLGHLTASAAVLSHDRSEVLLTLHPKFDMWLQLGGHCEPGDSTLVEAAAREADEESGIAGLAVSSEPIALDCHRVRCHGAPWDASSPVASLGDADTCWHLDVQYVAIAPKGAAHVISDESLDLRWWPVDGLPGQTDDALRRLVARAR